MKKVYWILFLLLLLNKESFSQQKVDSACRDSLYKIALLDTMSASGTTYLCFRIKAANGEIVPIAVDNRDLYYFFKKGGFDFKYYFRFMLATLRRNSVFNPASFVQKRYFPAYINCKPRKKNQRALKNGIDYTWYKYVLKMVHEAKGFYYMSESIADIIYQFWEWGVLMAHLDEGKTDIGPNCQGLKQVNEL
jgi:hypothetical protein